MKYLLIALVVLLASCDRRELIGCQCQGGIVIDKADFRDSFGVIYTIRYKGATYKHEVYEIEFDDYKVGDTINKPCIK